MLMRKCVCKKEREGERERKCVHVCDRVCMSEVTYIPGEHEDRVGTLGNFLGEEIGETTTTSYGNPHHVRRRASL